MNILRAHQIQPRDDPARVFGEMAETPVARLVRAAITAVEASLDPDTIASALLDNRFDVLWRHLALERLGPALRPALNRLAVVHDRSAIAATNAIGTSPIVHIGKARPSRLRTPDVINLTYDPLDPATVAGQNQTNATIVKGVIDAAEATAEQVVSDGLRANLAPSVIARNVRATLGLNEAEALAIDNYRKMLGAEPANSLARALRDKRYDRLVRRGVPTSTQIDSMVSAYAQRYRAFRAQRLAKTEALRAANQGRAAAWKQYGALTGRSYRRFWLTAGDELVCPVCAAIPGLNPEGIGPDERYDSPIGPIEMPPDPHPFCRCTERFERISSAEEPILPSTGGVGLRIDLDYGQ